MLDQKRMQAARVLSRLPGCQAQGTYGLVGSPEQLQPETNLTAAEDGIAALEELPSFGEKVHPAGWQRPIGCQPGPGDHTQQQQQQQPSFSFPCHQPLRLVSSAPPAAAAAPPPDCCTDANVIWDSFTFDDNEMVGGSAAAVLSAACLPASCTHKHTPLATNSPSAHN